MSQIGVLHLVDSLEIGGAEKVAVSLANSLPPERHRVYLCATRRDGPLARQVADHVGRLQLQRHGRFDFAAVWRLASFIRDRHIRILHAHSTSVFIATAAAILSGRPKVIWHDHYGRLGTQFRGPGPYRFASRFISAAIAVSEPLAEWSRMHLRLPADRIWYIPNFALAGDPEGPAPDLPGQKGWRIVQVANLRPEKDHATMLRAMSLVAPRVPQAHLLLAGSTANAGCAAAIRRQVATLHLDDCVSLLGERDDVPAILRVSDVGVLSSASEGLPLALIEYGAAGLPTVATAVGQCADVLDGGAAGVLVPPGSPEALADALCSVLESAERKVHFGQRLCARVRQFYSAAAVVDRVCQLYDLVLEDA